MGTQVALAGATEVRGLVPAVTRTGQRRDDVLEVRLHRVGLALELRPVRVREPGAALRLELVGGEVLRLQLDRLREVALEVGGSLARDPVDQIERDVVESSITKKGDRAPDVIGA